MNLSSNTQRDHARLRTWWIVWASLLISLCLIYFFLGRVERPPEVAQPGQGNPLAGLAGLVPLFISIIIRWLVLPRYSNLKRAFPMFVVGLVLAEACGLLGIFLGGPYRDDLFLLGVLGIAQYMPFFAKSFLEPKPQGFIPNN